MQIAYTKPSINDIEIAYSNDAVTNDRRGDAKLNHDIILD